MRCPQSQGSAGPTGTADDAIQWFGCTTLPVPAWTGCHTRCTMKTLSHSTHSAMALARSLRPNVRPPAPFRRVANIVLSSHVVPSLRARAVASGKASRHSAAGAVRGPSASRCTSCMHRPAHRCALKCIEHGCYRLPRVVHGRGRGQTLRLSSGSVARRTFVIICRDNDPMVHRCRTRFVFDTARGGLGSISASKTLTVAATLMPASSAPRPLPRQKRPTVHAVSSGSAHKWGFPAIARRLAARDANA